MPGSLIPDQHVLCQWAPVGNAFAFVNVNNIFYKATPKSEAIQITTDGDASIYNGVPDWVYEEEIFASNSALWFSGDGKRIAFVQFNDNLTPLMSIPYYGQPGHIESQYPRRFAVHYPKPGAVNPTVKLFTVVVDGLLPGAEVTKYELNVPASLAANDHVITTVSWANNENVIATWMNRVQNRCIIQNCELGTCRDLRNIESTTGWVEFYSAPHYNKDGSQIAIIESMPQLGNIGNYRHLAMTERLTGNTHSLTNGKFVVQDVLKWDADTNFIFYMANTEAESQVLHLYAIKGAERQTPQCLTCDMVNDVNIKQTYFEIEFSKNGEYLTLTSLGPGLPTVELYEWFVSGDIGESISRRLVGGC